MISNILPIKELKKKAFEIDCFTSIGKLGKIFAVISPSILGIIDIITDYIYYSTEPFSHLSLKQTCLFFMLFSPFL